MRLELEQMENLEPDFSVDDVLDALKEIRQNPEEWY